MTATQAAVWFAPPDEQDRFLPEGPRPAVGIDGEPIMWVNIQTGANDAAGGLHFRHWDGRHSDVPTPGRPGFVFPTDRPGVLLIGCDTTVGLFEPVANRFTPLAQLPSPHPAVIINDGEIVPGGKAVVFGTKDTRFEEPVACLYLFTLDDNRLTVLADGQTCSNGKVFADGGATLYDIDTPRKVVTKYALDVTARALREQGIAIDLRHRDDFPDGMCDCGDGTVIVAFYNPHDVTDGRAVRYRLNTGEAVEEWVTPGSPRVTCPLLVLRPDGVKLLLTTAVEGMPPELRSHCPNAGALFVADTSLAAVLPSEVLII
jgi:sugar lactone lactonase YvrE